MWEVLFLGVALITGSSFSFRYMRWLRREWADGVGDWRFWVQWTSGLALQILAVTQSAVCGLELWLGFLVVATVALALSRDSVRTFEIVQDGVGRTGPGVVVACGVLLFVESWLHREECLGAVGGVTGATTAATLFAVGTDRTAVIGP